MNHKTPDDDQSLFVLVLPFLAILFIVICYLLCKEPNNIGPRYTQEIRPRYTQEIWPRYTQEIRSRYVQETKSRDLPTGSTCSLEKAAEMAFTTEGTLLRTNTGYIYWSEPYEHAEKVFIRRTSASDIHSIWIKNSPCADCSRRLINHFSMRYTKPTIYIGKIWDGNDSDNFQGLRNMIMEGFTLDVWGTPKNHDIQQTKKYLAEL